MKHFPSQIPKNLLLTILILAIASGCTSYDSKTDAKEGASTDKVTKQSLVGYRFFDAKVISPPGATVLVYSPLKLPVSELLVSVGKHVDKGDIMMKLALPEAKQLEAQAQSNLRTAESDYAAAKAQNSSGVTEASHNLSEARAAELAAIRDQSNGNGSDVAGLTQARKDAEGLFQAAQSEMSAATRSERDAVDAARAFLAEAKAGAKMTNVRAPISGTVVSLDATAGSEVGVTPKTPVATIVDYQQFKVQATVPAEDKDLVTVGTPVILSPIDKGADQLECKVTAVKVAPIQPGEKTSTYIATVSFDNSKGVIKPATIVKKVGVKTGKADNVIVVPVASVFQNKEGKTAVNVENGKDVIEVVVETGITDGALIEIKSGLTEGQIVRVTTVIK